MNALDFTRRGERVEQHDVDRWRRSGRRRSEQPDEAALRAGRRYGPFAVQ
jgi:hypothetical protein